MAGEEEVEVPETCKKLSIDFIIRDTDPEMAAVEDDITKDLKRIGITVNKVSLDQQAYNDAEKEGDFNVVFTRTWGAPYDPHTYFNSWSVPSHSEYQAAGGLEAPLTRELLLEKVGNVLKETDPIELRKKWREILEDVHEQAMFAPLWGTRVPYVINRRLGGFSPGAETYRYDISTIKVFGGSENVTVAPGVGGGLFKTVGNLHPHQYSPNQLFAQGWMYETLVSYGQDGVIVPKLAESWSDPVDTAEGGQEVTFKLRPNVTFHDGTAFNCSVAKLNFDHVLSDIVKQRHSWLAIVQNLKSWTCNDDGDFVLETKDKFYPLLQELTYIRPLAFASAAAFEKGLDSDPDDHNSCFPGTLDERFSDTDLRCAGLSAPIGTGPFKFVEREQDETDDSTDLKVHFVRNEDYWGPIPEINFVTVPFFNDTDAVEAALLAGELDMALGIGPLSAKQVQDIKFHHSKTLDVQHSDVLQHAILVLNTNKAPTDDITTRQAIIHAINKGYFVEEEFAGLEVPVTQLLPYSAPYSDVDLAPAWGYDLEKAKLLNCPVPPPTMLSESNDESSKLSDGAIAGIVICALAAVLMALFVANLISREKQGKPMFQPDKAGEAA